VSVNRLLHQAAAGAGGDPVYVDDVFSTFLYDGNGAAQGIQNGINLGNFGAGTSTEFNGAGDYLQVDNLFENGGVSASKTFTLSLWVFWQATANQTIVNFPTFNIGTNSQNLTISGFSSSYSTILNFTSSATLSLNSWNHILISIDMNNSSNRHVYINDAADGGTFNNYTNSTIGFEQGGAQRIASNAAAHFKGRIAHAYMDFTYRDLSTESNRRSFIDANGGSTPVSTLTALSPPIYLPMTDAYAVGKNVGSLGDFSATYGSPTIVQSGTEYVADSGKGGLTWFKARDDNTFHILFDTERGGTKWLRSDSANKESTASPAWVTYNSDGFTLPQGINGLNNTQEMVSWTFRKQKKFFDIVTYTGNGTAGTEIAHNLGSTPGMVFVKTTGPTFGGSWRVWHRSVPNNVLRLNQTAGISAIGNSTTTWGDDSVVIPPTSTHFTIGSESDVNRSGAEYVAYLFAHDAQDFGTNSDEAIIKCGNYTGSGSTGKFVDLGFEPQWVLIKNTDAGTPWVLIDTMRGMVINGDGVRLLADQSVAEVSSASYFAPRPTGMEVTQQNTYVNTSGQNYVYMAIRRPHKPASEFAATKLFNVDAGANTTPGFDTGFPIDMGIFRLPDSTSDFDIMARLTQPRRLDFTAGTEANKGAMAQMDYMDGWSTSANNYRGWAWRRAPGYFDVVCWSGNNTNGRTLAHNLGVTPEMMWVKARTVGESWYVYHTATGATKAIYLNGTQAPATSVGFWNDTAPTSSVFSVYSAFTNSSSQTYIAYLFASVDGISKVGNYTGTGSDLNVDCGFSAGASFVLIRRTDSTGDWYVWDSVGGIVAGNDPYLLFNSDAAQVTNTDYIDPLSSGFTVTSSAPAGLNASSGTYIFYAIA